MGNELKIEQKLDTILEILYKRRFSEVDKGPLQIQQLCDRLKLKDRSLEHEELFELFAILYNDGYVLLKTEEKENADKVKNARISLQGVFLNQNGGYTKKLADKEKEKAREFWKGVIVTSLGICIGFGLELMVEPAKEKPAPVPAAIVLPKVQVIHDTIYKTVLVKEPEKPKKKKKKKAEEE